MSKIKAEDWADLHRWLDEALELPEEERAVFAKRVCAGRSGLEDELLQMIAALDLTEDYFLDEPIVAPNPDFAEDEVETESEPLHSPKTDETPVMLGPYRIQHLLGSGGMGQVFLAVRDDREYQKKVAIKVLRRESLSSEMIRRFRHERQILAGLEHPGIAGLLDGGTAADGRPYLVMEYVEGKTIDVYCADNDLGVEARLSLFTKVCEAVHFAHQRLVVHRDLKPGNILIADDGTPKLLDFGIAKLLDPQALDLDLEYQSPVTAFGLRPMTLEYASPEQIYGATLTTASDIYSLGVLFFELLSGFRPYKVTRQNPGEAIQQICQEDPPRPSTVVGDPGRFDLPHKGMPPDTDGKRLKRRLSGDLDRIAMKALAKDPGERYSSVEQMALDVTHHRQGMPISARTHTWKYRTAKFVQRHRVAVTATTAFFVVLVGLLVALWRQQQQTLLQWERAEKVSEFLMQTFRLSDPDEARGREITAFEILEGGVEKLVHGDLAPENKVDFLDVMGTSFMYLGEFEQAEPLFLESQALRRQIEDDELALAGNLFLTSELRIWQGDYQAAKDMASESFDLISQRLGSDSPEARRVLVRKARALHLEGDLEAAEAEFELAFSLAEEMEIPVSEQVAALEFYAFLLRDLARFEDAQTRLETALDLARRNELPPRRIGRILNGFGLLLESQGKYPMAERQFREAESIQKPLIREGLPNTELATTWHNLAALKTRLGQYGEAEELFRDSLDVRRRGLHEEHPKVAASLGGLGRLLMLVGRLDEAEDGFAEALRIYENQLGENHLETARAYRRMADLRAERGDFEGSIRLYEKAVAVQRQELGAAHPDVGVTLNNWAKSELSRGSQEKALRLYQQALAILEKAHGPDHADIASMHYNVAGLHHRLGDIQAAERGYRRALVGAQKVYGFNHWRVALILVALGSVELQKENYSAASALAGEAMKLLSDQSGFEAWKDSALTTSGEALMRQGDYEEALPILRERLALGFNSEAAATRLQEAEAALAASKTTADS